MFRGRMLVSREAKAYKAHVCLIAKAKRLKCLSGPVLLRLTVYRPRKVGDLSNRIKVLEDALIGLAYEDDEQVTEIHAMRRDDKDNPRVEIEVSEI